jgi:DNA-binding response OmpR family regulator
MVKPDLVIADGLMPKLHGFMVCKMLKQLEPPPKVILLTAVYTKPEYRTKAKEQYGADELLTKPCRTDDLLACIENLLGRQGEQEPTAVDFDLFEV